MLAYATALGLPGCLPIYAAGEAEAMSYRVRRAGRGWRWGRWTSPARWG